MTATAVIPRPTRSAENRLAVGAAASTCELLAVLAGAQPGSRTWTAVRAELVQRHLGLVRALAWRFRGRGEDLDDLVQVGMVGLLNAINRFDPGRGAEFTTYATPTVVGELKRHLRDRGSTVRIPRRLAEHRAAVARASAVLYAGLGRAPTVGELAEALRLDAEDVLEALDAPLTLVPLDGHDDAYPEHAFDGVEHRAALRPLLCGLPPRDRQILALRFFAHRTQSEIAAELGISQVQVSRLLSRTLARLRQALTTL